MCFVKWRKAQSAGSKVLDATGNHQLVLGPNVGVGPCCRTLQQSFLLDAASVVGPKLRNQSHTLPSCPTGGPGTGGSRHRAAADTAVRVNGVPPM